MMKSLSSLPLHQICIINSILSKYGEVKLIGGCVRDMLMNKFPYDIDLATTVRPDVMVDIFKQNRIKIITNNIKHGVVTVIIDQKTFEIATLRIDVTCDGRRAEVEYTNEWQEDAKRRDFTINAMSMDIHGNIYDYFNGCRDLEDRLIRFIGNADQRIKEDHLRLLRYFRFYGVLGSKRVDTSSLKAVRANLSLIPKLSGERIKQEMFKLLSSKYAQLVTLMMFDCNVWPHLNINDIDHDAVKKMHFSGNAVINLCALIRNTKYPLKNLQNILNIWRLSNTESNIIRRLVDQTFKVHIDNMVESKRTLYNIGRDVFIQKIELMRVEKPAQDYRELFNLAHIHIPPFPLSGDDVKEMGFKGKDIGDRLSKIRQIWIESDFRLQKKELKNLLINYY